MDFVVRPRVLAAALLLLSLTGCETWRDRPDLQWPDLHWPAFLSKSAEFAPPQSRWPDTLPGAVAADAAPPPRLVTYCYRTLASVDCFTSPQPERLGGFAGRYPVPNSAP
jgi:hypothetical protein